MQFKSNLKKWVESRIVLMERRKQTLMRLLKKKDFSEIKRRFKRIYLMPKKAIHASQEDKIFVILTTLHTLFIARLIQSSLEKFGFHDTQIFTQEPLHYSDNIHIIVCPQMFSQMPSRYIAFQMEQSVSSRWFTPKYFNLLEHSIAILDYSLQNIYYMQNNGLSYRQMFYAPISNIIGYHETNIKPQETKEYDVVFYGDAHNPRRKAFLDAIGKKFSLLVVSEVFGDELYKELSRAKIMVNIHYYENALLETTRIFESLSLGMMIISEESSDMHDHNHLLPLITFSPLNDIEAMISSIESKLMDYDRQTQHSLNHDVNSFDYYFGRMLASLDIVDTQALLKFSIVSKEKLSKGVALSLPETFERYHHFQITHPEIEIFHGLRHLEGWIGAGMSFKYLCSLASHYELPYLEICEDDVLLSADFTSKKEIVFDFLFSHLGTDNWDIFCGMIADVSSTTKIIDVIEYQGMQFIIMDQMTSMVYNIYNKNAIKLIADWNPNNRDVHQNAIDRYLQQQTKLRVICALPYTVGHKPELTSSIWGFENNVYDELIDKSEKELTKKVSQFLARRDSL